MENDTSIIRRENEKAAFIEEQILERLGENDKGNGIAPRDLAELVCAKHPELCSNDVFERILDMGSSGLLEFKNGFNVCLPISHRQLDSYHI